MACLFLVAFIDLQLPILLARLPDLVLKRVPDTLQQVVTLLTLLVLVVLLVTLGAVGVVPGLLLFLKVASANK